MAEIVTESSIDTQSTFYYAAAAIVIGLTAILTFGGIRKVTKVTDRMVPVMAVIYVGTTLILIAVNLDSVPYFFRSVLEGAFTPAAILAEPSVPFSFKASNAASCQTKPARGPSP